MIWYLIRPLCVADFPDLGDPTITGPNDILGAGQVRRYGVIRQGQLSRGVSKITILIVCNDVSGAVQEEKS